MIVAIVRDPVRRVLTKVAIHALFSTKGRLFWHLCVNCRWRLVFVCYPNLACNVGCRLGILH